MSDKPENAAPEHSLGVILAGGQSRRMGGGDKALMRLAGRPMLAHVIDRFRPQVLQLILNANGDPARFASFGLPVVADTIAGYAGPLAGVLAGLRWAAANTPARWIVTASADAPFLPEDAVARLTAALASAPDAEIAVAASRGRVHPVVGLFPVALADQLEAALRSGARGADVWTQSRRRVVVAFADVAHGSATIDPFFNVNTPEDLNLAEMTLAI